MHKFDIEYRAASIPGNFNLVKFVIFFTKKEVEKERKSHGPHSNKHIHINTKYLQK